MVRQDKYHENAGTHPGADWKFERNVIDRKELKDNAKKVYGKLAGGEQNVRIVNAAFNACGTRARYYVSFWTRKRTSLGGYEQSRIIKCISTKEDGNGKK